MSVKQTKSTENTESSAISRHTSHQAHDSLPHNDAASDSEEENPFLAKDSVISPGTTTSEAPDVPQSELEQLRDENKRLVGQNEVLRQEADKWRSKAKEYKRKCHLLKGIVTRTQEQLEGWEGVTTTTGNDRVDHAEERGSENFSKIRSPETDDIDEKRRAFYASVRPKVVVMSHASTSMHLSRQPPATDLGISALGQWRGPFEPSPLKPRPDGNATLNLHSSRLGNSPTKRISRSVSPAKRTTPARPRWN